METTFTDEQYALPFPLGIEAHYWHRARNALCEKLLARVVSRSQPVLDIGCGPGIMVDHLRRAGWEAFGVDTGTPPHPLAAAHLSLGADAFALEASFRDSIAAISLLDVLEHLDDPRAFLARCASAFASADHVLVTVPARSELWSNYDEFYGHRMRYTAASLNALFEKGPFERIDSGYFFHTLYLPALAQTRLQKKRSVAIAAPKAALLHRLVARALVLDSAWLPRAFPGTSLYALARRR